MHRDNLSGNFLVHPLPLLGTALIFFYCLVYIAPLGHRPLFVPDESRYAEIPREMVDNGDWSKMNFIGRPYYEKPPLGYWLNAVSISLFGHNAFAVRLPSALSAGVSALAIFFLVLLRRKNAPAALAAAIVYLSCVQVFGVGTFAVMDSMFSLFVCLSMVLFFASGEVGARWRAALLALSGAACGAAFLTKGFTALVIPAVTLAVWLPWEGKFRGLLRAWIIPTLAAGALVLPAALLIHRSNPDFWNYFFWIEHVQRFLDPSGGQHEQPFWFYLPTLAVGAIPWIFFLPAVIPGIGRLARRDSLIRFCLCWFAMPFLFFSVCGGKLPTYILPCFPPFAILVAEALCEADNGKVMQWCAKATTGIFLIAPFVFLAWLHSSSYTVLQNGFPVVGGTTLMFAAAIFATALCLYLASRLFALPRKRGKAIGLVGASMTGMCLASLLLLPECVEEQRSPCRLLAECVELSPENVFLAADRFVIPSACWYYRRDDVLLFKEEGELEYGLRQAAGTENYVATSDELGKVVRAKLEDGIPVAVMARKDRFPDLSNVVEQTASKTTRQSSRYAWVLLNPVVTAERTVSNDE